MFRLTLPFQDAQDKQGFTSLHCAAVRGLLPAAKMLIEGRAELDVWDERGFTAFHLAAGRGHVAVLRLLLEAAVLVEGPGWLLVVEGCG